MPSARPAVRMSWNVERDWLAASEMPSTPPAGHMSGNVDRDWLAAREDVCRYQLPRPDTCRGM